MEFIIFIGILLIICLTALFLLCKWLWKKGTIGRIISIALPICILTEAYFGFFPPDSFYKSEFEKISKTEFPSSGVVLSSYASYPDTHGDYISCALIEVSNEEYSNLVKFIKNSDDFTEGGKIISCSYNLVVPPKELLYSTLSSQEGGYEMSWGLVKNENQIYISFSSW